MNIQQRSTTKVSPNKSQVVNSDGYIIYLVPPPGGGSTSSTIYNPQASHFTPPHKPPELYKKSAATAPTPATKPPTLAWLAAPVNSETGALYAPVPEGAAVPTSEARGVLMPPVGTMGATTLLVG